MQKYPVHTVIYMAKDYENLLCLNSTKTNILENISDTRNTESLGRFLHSLDLESLR